MTNYQIFNVVNILLNKDDKGQYQLDQFNDILPAEARNYFDYVLRRYDNDWKARKSLRPFLRETDSATIRGSGSISYETVVDNFAKILEMRVHESGRFVEEVDNIGDWYDRLDSKIKEPTAKHPIARLKSGDIEIKPSSVGTIDIYYLEYPTEPYMDGYYDSDSQFQYLGEGETVDLDATGGTGLDGSTSGTYTSSTVELDFYDEDKLEIASRILADLGVSHNKQSLVQYANMMRSED